MDFYRKRIKDGVNLSTLSDSKYKTDYTVAAFILPLTEHNAAYTSLLAEVLSKSCTEYPQMILLNRALDELYDAEIGTCLFKSGENLVFSFYLSALRGKYSLDKTDIRGGSLEILLQLLTRPLTVNGGFDPEAVKSESRQLIENIRAAENNKPAYAVSRCVQLMCAGEPYAIETRGKAESILKITPVLLYDFYKNVLLNSPCEIIGTSEYKTDIQLEEFTYKLSCVLTPKPFSRFPSVFVRPESIREVTEEKRAEQSILCLGYRTNIYQPGFDRTAYGLFARIFSADPTSRLFTNVREKLSLCYFCRAKDDLNKGVTVISAGIEADKALLCREEIIRQLTDIQNGNITDEETEACRRTARLSMRSLTDSPSSAAWWYLSRIIQDLPYDLSALLEKVQKTTKEQIVCASRSLIPDMFYLLRGADNE